MLPIDIEKKFKEAKYYSSQIDDESTRCAIDSLCCVLEKLITEIEQLKNGN